MRSLILELIIVLWIYQSAKELTKTGVNMMSPKAWGGFAALLIYLAAPLYILFYFTRYRPQLKEIEKNKQFMQSYKDQPK